MDYTNAQTARIGVAGVQQLVCEELGWIFREQPLEDYGIDAHIEICENGIPTGRLLAVQIKSGASRFFRKNETGYRFSDSLRHLEYWTAYSLPVVLILYDPGRRRAFWVPVERERVSLHEKTWEITVPYAFRLNRQAREALRALAVSGGAPAPSAAELSSAFRSTDAARAVLQALSAARQSIEIAAPFLDVPFLWALKTCAHRCAVRLLTGGACPGMLQQELLLAEKEAPALQCRTASMLHDKYILLDRRIVIYGSACLTSGAWRSPSEEMLAEDMPYIVQRYAGRFHAQWSTALPAARRRASTEMPPFRQPDA